MGAAIDRRKQPGAVLVLWRCVVRLSKASSHSIRLPFSAAVSVIRMPEADLEPVVTGVVLMLECFSEWLLLLGNNLLIGRNLVGSYFEVLAVRVVELVTLSWTEAVDIGFG